MGNTSSARFRQAMRGDSIVPPLAGLTFVPLDVLRSVARECGDHADCVLVAARDLGLDFVFVSESVPWAEDVVRAREGLAVLWVVDGPLWPSLATTGSVRQGLALTERDPASLVPSLEAETARAMEAVRRGRRLGVDAVVVAEDLAGTRGLLVAPAFAQEHVVPRLARLVGAAGPTPVLFHSDGDIRQLLRPLRAAGFAGVHTGGGVDRDTFEALFWEARRSGLVVAGGVETAAVGRGTFAAVRAGTRAALLAQAGGLLVADDGGIVTVAEMTGYATALDALRGGAATEQPVRSG